MLGQRRSKRGRVFYAHSSRPFIIARIKLSHTETNSQIPPRQTRQSFSIMRNDEDFPNVQSVFPGRNANANALHELAEGNAGAGSDSEHDDGGGYYRPMPDFHYSSSPPSSPTSLNDFSFFSSSSSSSPPPSSPGARFDSMGGTRRSGFARTSTFGSQSSWTSQETHAEGIAKAEDDSEQTLLSPSALAGPSSRSNGKRSFSFRTHGSGSKRRRAEYLDVGATPYERDHEGKRARRGDVPRSSSPSSEDGDMDVTPKPTMFVQPSRRTDWQGNENEYSRGASSTRGLNEVWDEIIADSIESSANVLDLGYVTNLPLLARYSLFSFSSS